VREDLRRPLVTPTLRGVPHLKLCTDDMKATIDFNVDVLGMPLVNAMKVPSGLGTGPGNRGNPPYERVRHYFSDMGNDSLLAFFEIPRGKEPGGNRNAIGAMQHCAFVVTAERFREVEARLKAHGIDYIGPSAAPRIAWHLLLRPQRHSPRVRLPARGRRGTRGDPLHYSNGGGAGRTRDPTGRRA
jgi:catechol 2,3-dioxygenase-like lactoylglutathione lyase family enzyme